MRLDSLTQGVGVSLILFKSVTLLDSNFSFVVSVRLSILNLG